MSSPIWITRRAAAVAAGFAAVLGACAGLPAAQMALPSELAARQPEAIAGIGVGRQGDFVLAADRVTFTRGRDRTELFGVASFDRSPTRYTLRRADGGAIDAACRGRQDTVTLGVLQGRTKPFTFECEWRGPSGRVASLDVAAPSRWQGARAERSGSFTQGAITLAIRSVHEVQGSPLPVEAPIGYVISHQGRPVGAVELNGSTPRLWRPGTGDALREPVTLAALALALLWDPSASDD